MKDEFFIVLPSNSSMKYYPGNLTTRYITQLPQSVSLSGKWVVSLAEIHIPMTILHVPPEGDKNFIEFVTNVVTRVPGAPTSIDFKEDRVCVPPGMYRSIESLIEAINDLSCVMGHFRFHCTRNGYVAVTRICEACKNLEHSFRFSGVLNKILGFEHSRSLVVQDKKPFVAPQPASLINGIPGMLFVYSDICEPYIIGDVHAPLLRVIPFDIANNYNYGSVKIRTFSSPRYVPLLRSSFQTIKIDIRDEFGQPIPFEGGTLTVTLQFKRVD